MLELQLLYTLQYKYSSLGSCSITGTEKIDRTQLVLALHIICPNDSANGVTELDAVAEDNSPHTTNLLHGLKSKSLCNHNDKVPFD